MNRIAHITDFYSVPTGGATAVVNQLSRRLIPFFKRTEIICVRGDAMPSENGINVFNINPVWWGKTWGWSSELKQKIDSLAETSDFIFHIHGVWMAPQWLAANRAAKKNIPFILSTHGMMAPALLELSRIVSTA